MRRRVLVMLTLGLACTNDGGTPTAYTLPETPSASAVCATFTSRYRAMTDATSLPAWLDVFAHIVPGGYAGYDALRAKPTLLLVDPSQFTAAKANISALVRCTDFPQHLGFAVPTDTVAAVRYDFTRLYAWDKLLASSLGKASGVITRQFDLARNRIQFFVVDAAAAAEVRGTARRMGVPDEATDATIVAR
jgi:hypothetical protein